MVGSATQLRAQSAIVGVGESAYERGAGDTLMHRIAKVSMQAITDAGFAPGEVDGIIQPPGYVGWDEIATHVGMTNIRYTAQMQIGGASSVAALLTAAMALHSGLARAVLIPIGWNGYSALRPRPSVARERRRFSPAFFETVRSYYAPYGLRSPAWWYAMYVNRYVEQYLVSPDAAAEVAMAARSHAQATEGALMRGRPMTRADYDSAPRVVDPFRRYDCALETDCAAAVVMTTRDRAAGGPHVPVTLLGAAEAHMFPANEIHNRVDPLAMAVEQAAPRALAMAGAMIDDLDFAQLYDPFSHIVLMQLEALGFAEAGGAQEFVRDGGIRLGGALPVNTHGGLLSQGHCWGMNHVIEAVRQLRHSRGKAQVADCEIGVVTGYGDLGDASVAILGRGAQ